MSDLGPLTQAIKDGDRGAAEAQTQAAIDAGTSAQDILSALTDGMDDVGRRFKAAEIYVPNVLIAARAMNVSMALLEPQLVKEGIEPSCTVLVGTVEGDLHDIGKNLVAMMWRGAHFGVVDLGTNVSPDDFVKAAKETGATLCGLSALLTTTRSAMRTTIEAIREAGLTDLKVIVGGAPITQEYADEIGADGYAPDAGSAVEVARSLANV
ncbi:MAG: cobalamin-binding protein [Planctomycetaceae bacterium]|nr:cobalamin-binding protein [Planctomycetaceae bacterium]